MRRLYIESYHYLYIPEPAVVQHKFPKLALIGYQTMAFILSFFRNIVSKSNQIDSLKKAQDDPEPEQVVAYKKYIKYLFLKKIARNIKNHRIIEHYSVPQFN